MVAKRGLSPSLSKCVLFRGKTLDKSLTDNKWGVFYDTEAGFGLCHAICDGKAADLQRLRAEVDYLKNLQALVWEREQRQEKKSRQSRN